MGSLRFKFYFNHTLERKITKAFKHNKSSAMGSGAEIGGHAELFQAGFKRQLGLF